ncbi:unnamed protein product [Orchesella dallaii]|uniref:Uncharacterized protein n=1 Tax=Orchesella dallaii TaxID=48710 RepID=A0ABP1PT83_9HEXA
MSSQRPGLNEGTLAMLGNKREQNVNPVVPSTTKSKVHRTTSNTVVDSSSFDESVKKVKQQHQANPKSDVFPIETSHTKFITKSSDTSEPGDSSTSRAIKMERSRIKNSSIRRNSRKQMENNSVSSNLNMIETFSTSGSNMITAKESKNEIISDRAGIVTEVQISQFINKERHDLIPKPVKVHIEHTLQNEALLHPSLSPPIPTSTQGQQTKTSMAKTGQAVASPGLYTKLKKKSISLIVNNTRNQTTPKSMRVLNEHSQQNKALIHQALSPPTLPSTKGQPTSTPKNATDQVNTSFSQINTSRRNVSVYNPMAVCIELNPNPNLPPQTNTQAGRKMDFSSTEQTLLKNWFLQMKLIQFQLR